MSFVQELRVIRWTELGEILQVKKERNKRKDNFSFTQDEIWFIHFLQLLEMVYGEAGVEAPKLNLTFLCDNRFLHFILHLRVKTLPGWRSTSWKCRSVSAQESRSWTSPCSTSPSTTRMRQQLLSWASPAPCTLSLRWKFRGFEEDLLTLLARSWEILKFNTWMTRRPSGRASKACRPTWPGSASTRWWASPSRPCPPSRWTAGGFLFTNANAPYT